MKYRLAQDRKSVYISELRDKKKVQVKLQLIYDQTQRNTVSRTMLLDCISKIMLNVLDALQF